MKPWIDVPVSEGTAERIFKEVSRHIRKSDKSVKLLDFGAGNGHYLDIFSRKFLKEEMYGTEVDPEMIRLIAQKGYTAVDLREREVLPFENGYFDIIFSSNVLEHLSKDLYKKYLAEIYRCLSNDGVFLVGLPNYPFKRLYDIHKAFSNASHFKYYLFDDPTHVNKMSIARFVKDLGYFFFEIKLTPGFYCLQRFVDRLHIELDQTNVLSLLCDKYFGYAKNKRPNRELKSKHISLK